MTFMGLRARQVVLLVVISFFILMFGNGLVSLTNPDEVFYAQTAKEMIKYQTWMTPYLFDQPQFEKPIMTYWLLRISFILFGPTNFAARFFPALFAICGVMAVYFLGLIGFKDSKKSFLSALVLASGAVYLGMARSVFTDMIFSVLIGLSLLFFYWGYVCPDRKPASVFLFFIASALAVLTKGPLGFLIPGLAIILFLVVRRDLKYLVAFEFIAGLLVFFAMALPWYMLMVQKYGTVFTHEFFYNDHVRRLLEAEHISNDSWYFYPFSMVIGMFPWSIFSAAALFFLVKRIRQLNDFELFLVSWITAVFVVFEPAHSKLVSYILPLWPALALTTGGFISSWIEQARGKWLFIANCSFLVCIPIALLVGRFRFPGYLTTFTAVNAYIVIFIVLIITMFYLVNRRSFVPVLGCCVLCLPLFISLVPFIHKDIEPYVSSRPASEYLVNNYSIDSVVLCSKFYARGVRYYTQKNIAVCDSGHNFFSPHPIPYLNTDEKLLNFLKSQDVTYAVLKKSDARNVERLAQSAGFQARELAVFGNEHVVRIEI